MTKRMLGGFLLTCVLVVAVAIQMETSTAPNANKTTHGVIRRDEVWRGEIRVVGDIFVEPGVTLTIEPGTRVLIAANSDVDNLQTYEPADLKQGICSDRQYEHIGVHPGEPFRDEENHIYIGVEGTLNAVGTPDAMITITSDSPSPGRYDWTGIHFRNGTLSYAVVEYYRHLDPGKDATISNCVLRHIGECAVCLSGERSPTIEGNTIHDTGHELIDTHSPASPVIRNNHLGPNPSLVNPGGVEFGGVGIILDRTSPEIAGNTFEECGVAVAFINGPPVIPFEEFSAQLCTDNSFVGNGVDFFVECTDTQRNCRRVQSGTQSNGDDDSRPGRGKGDLGP